MFAGPRAPREIRRLFLRGPQELPFDHLHRRAGRRRAPPRQRHLRRKDNLTIPWSRWTLRATRTSCDRGLEPARTKTTPPLLRPGLRTASFRSRPPTSPARGDLRVHSVPIRLHEVALELVALNERPHRRRPRQHLQTRPPSSGVIRRRHPTADLVLCKDPRPPALARVGGRPWSSRRVITITQKGAWPARGGGIALSQASVPPSRRVAQISIILSSQGSRLPLNRPEEIPLPEAQGGILIDYRSCSLVRSSFRALGLRATTTAPPMTLRRLRYQPHDSWPSTVGPMGTGWRRAAAGLGLTSFVEHPLLVTRAEELTDLAHRRGQ